MSDYISKSALIKSIRRKVVIASGEELDFKGEIVELIQSQPTLDETEVIRKAFERVVDKLCDLQPFLTADGQYVSLYEVVQTIKKECGIRE